MEPTDSTPAEQQPHTPVAWSTVALNLIWAACIIAAIWILTH